MHRVTFFVLCLLVFTIPCQEVFAFEEFESGSRMIGYVALVCAFFAIIARGRFQRLTPTFIVLFLFWLSTALSIAWTINSDDTLEKVVTYTADMLLAWLVCEFAATVKRQVILLCSFLLGVCVNMADMFYMFLTRGQFVDTTQRFSGGGANENEMAYLAVFSVCIAVYFLARKTIKFRVARPILWAFIPAAALSDILTGSRGGAIALVAAGAVLFFSLRRTGWGFRLMFVAAVFAVIVIIPRVVPEDLLKRETEGTESHTFELRKQAWEAAVVRWAKSPLLGAGAGTFREAVWGLSGGIIGHSLYFDVLVEEGLVGLGLYLAAALTVLYAVWRMPPADRPFWFAILAVWLLGSIVSPWEYGKLTWFLFSAIASLSAALRAEASASPARLLPAVAAALPYRQSWPSAT